MVKLLTRDPTVVVDHRKILCSTASIMDKWLSKCNPLMSSKEFKALKERLAETKDVESLMVVLMGDTVIKQLLSSEFSDVIMAEMVDIDSSTGPLSEFPPSVNSNIYSRIVKFGLSHCPQTMAVLLRLAVKSQMPVLPTDVLVVANHFANICYLSNSNLDGLVKMRSLALQAGGTTDRALDLLSDMGMAETARSLTRHKDLFAEVGPMVMQGTYRHMPTTQAMDNLDFNKEHLMMKCSLREQVDTSGLSTVKMPKSEALKLFTKEMLMLDAESNREERRHLLEDVIATGWGRILAERRPVAEKLSQYLRPHHKHSLASSKLMAAMFFIDKIYPCQETRHSHMIKLILPVAA